MTPLLVIPDLKKLKNIGERMEKSLNRIGIFSKFQLMNTGAVEAMKKIQAVLPKESIDLYHWLYALQGALLDLDWRDLPDKIKYHLRKQAGLPQ